MVTQLSTESEVLLAKAQAFVDRKYVARADDRQRSMGLAYVEAERQDLAREIVRFVQNTRASLTTASGEAATPPDDQPLTMSMFLTKGDLEKAIYRDRIRAAIEGIMVSHNGYSSPMLAERITDAVLALPSQDGATK
jgi:hypothetical protein